MLKNQSIVEYLTLDSSSEVHLVQPLSLRLGELEQVAQGHIQSGFEHLQRKRFHNVTE